MQKSVLGSPPAADGPSMGVLGGLKLRAHPEEAPEVVGQAHEGPLERDFREAAQQEAAEAHRVFDETKDWFDGLLALFVSGPALGRGSALGQLVQK